MVDLDRLERVLIQAAREGRPVTYGQVLAFFGWKVTLVTVGALCRDLGHVAERRRGELWPDLACLVVRKSDGLPGEGYFTSLRNDGVFAGPSVGPGAEAVVRARQLAARRWAAGLPAAATDPYLPRADAVGDFSSGPSGPHPRRRAGARP